MYSKIKLQEPKDEKRQIPVLVAEQETAFVCTGSFQGREVTFWEPPFKRN